jgi:hypothetical protein
MSISSNAVTTTRAIAERVPPFQDWDVEIVGAELKWSARLIDGHWRIYSTNSRWDANKSENGWEMELADSDWRVP